MQVILHSPSHDLIAILHAGENAKKIRSADRYHETDRVIQILMGDEMHIVSCIHPFKE